MYPPMASAPPAPAGMYPPPYAATAPAPPPRPVEAPRPPTVLTEYAVYVGVDGRWSKMRAHQFHAFRRAKNEMDRTGAKHAAGTGGGNSYNVKLTNGIYWIQLGGGTYHAVLDYFAPPPPQK